MVGPPNRVSGALVMFWLVIGTSAGSMVPPPSSVGQPVADLAVLGELPLDALIVGGDHPLRLAPARRVVGSGEAYMAET